MQTVTLREVVRELWIRGELNWKLRPVQQRIDAAIKASPSIKHVLNASRRIGKSYEICKIAAETSIKKPSLVRMAAPTQKALKKIILPIFRDLFRDCPGEIRPVWRAQDGLFYFPYNGSEIHISGANNGHDENLRGTSADLCLIDEAGFIKGLKYLVEDILMPQLLTTGGRLIMSSTPPRTPAHDFVGYAQQAEQDGNYSIFTIHDSGYPLDLIAKFCKEAGGEFSTTWLREYLCQFVVDSDWAIIPEWKSAYEGYVERDEFFPFYHRYEALDIGVRDFTAELFGFYEFRKARLVIEDELLMRGSAMTTDKLAKDTRDKEFELWPDPHYPAAERRALQVYRRIADNNNLLLVNDLTTLHDLPFAPTTKDTLESMVNEARMFINSGRLVVSPKCKHLLGCLKYGIWAENRRKFDRSAVYGHFDGLAALIYFIRNLDQNTDPVPALYGLSKATMFIPKNANGESKNDAAARAITGILRRN